MECFIIILFGLPAKKLRLRFCCSLNVILLLTKIVLKWKRIYVVYFLKHWTAKEIGLEMGKETAKDP
jgi:hypothetical protein